MAKKKVLLTKNDLVEKIAESCGETKSSVGKMIDTYPTVVVKTLMENLPDEGEISGAVPLPGFGTIAVKHQPATERKNNLGGGEMVQIPAHYSPSFKISKGIKTSLNSDLIEDISKSIEKKSGKKGA